MGEAAWRPCKLKLLTLHFCETRSTNLDLCQSVFEADDLHSP